MRVYEYEGRKFEISKGDACELTISRGSYTAEISVHAATNEVRESVNGWGNDHPSLEGAIRGGCRRILELEARPKPEDLCTEMSRFYDKLSSSPAVDEVGSVANVNAS